MLPEFGPMELELGLRLRVGPVRATQKLKLAGIIDLVQHRSLNPF